MVESFIYEPHTAGGQLTPFDYTLTLTMNGGAACIALVIMIMICCVALYEPRLRLKKPWGMCYDCERPYSDGGFCDLVIPDEDWKKISPTGDEGGLLCPSCIIRRLELAGIQTTGKFMSGPLCEKEKGNV